MFACVRWYGRGIVAGFIRSGLFDAAFNQTTTMSTWIALFRGINVGGKNVLKMADLRAMLESVNCRNVQTYIQSGNVVFESSTRSAATLSKKISKLVRDEHGFDPKVLVMTAARFRQAIDDNPFPAAVKDPKSLHFFFLAQPSMNPDLERMQAAKKASEQYQLTDFTFYLHAPDGFHGSKLAAKAETLLGVDATARNFRTVDKLNELIQDAAV